MPGRTGATWSPIRFGTTRPTWSVSRSPSPTERTSSPRRCPATNGSASPDWRPTARANTRLSATELDRFALDETGTFWLSETPEEPGSRGWDGNHPRVATLAHLDDETTDRPLVHVNTHLDNRGEAARREGAALVAERVQALADDTTPVVTGDLNCLAGDPRTHGSTAWIWATAAGWNPPPRPRPSVTARRPRGTDFHELDPGRKIDHVFVPTDCSVTGYAALTDRDETRYPSDHLPVVADVVRR